MRGALSYLVAKQQPEGHWTQNFHANGRPVLTGVQLDEVGFPIVLAASLRADGEPASEAVARMVERAAGYLVQRGPLTPQDRWEERAGASPFTLAIEVAALAAAGDWLGGGERDYALGLADCWNERIEEWVAVTGTQLAREHGVDGYDVRIGPAPPGADRSSRVAAPRASGARAGTEALVGLDFLYLARLGLRRADEPLMAATLRAADALLQVQTPNGPAYRRYPHDRYGEHEDGSPFDGQGVGRPWPLLTERGHGALLAGEGPTPYLEAMARLAGPGGLIPEQVWDQPSIAERRLEPGQPTGSAMPLAWAHAEFLKLLVARDSGRPVERLESVPSRYRGQRPRAAVWYWRAEAPIFELPRGRALVVESARPFTRRHGFDGWQQAGDRAFTPLGFGMHGVAIAAEELRSRASLEFTRRYGDRDRWEGCDHRVVIRDDSRSSCLTASRIR